MLAYIIAETPETLTIRYGLVPSNLSEDQWDVTLEGAKIKLQKVLAHQSEVLHRQLDRLNDCKIALRHDALTIAEDALTE